MDLLLCCTCCCCLQGHEEFDDEITLAGSGQVTPSHEMLQQIFQAANPQHDATSNTHDADAPHELTEGPQQTLSDQCNRYAVSLPHDLSAPCTACV